MANVYGWYMQLADYKERRRVAAITIQCAFRVAQARKAYMRKWERRQQAAYRVQAIWKGYHLREGWEEKKKETLLYNAAYKIQKSMRRSMWRQRYQSYRANKKDKAEQMRLQEEYKAAKASRAQVKWIEFINDSADQLAHDARQMHQRTLHASHQELYMLKRQFCQLQQVQ
eukprot:gene15293-4577_t